MRRLAPVLAAVLVAAAVGGCQGSKVDRTGQASAGFYAPSFEILWEVARKEMGRAGFVPDPEASSRETKVLVSRWSTNLAPFSGRGTREQATVTLRPIPERADHYSVEANVIRQANMNIKAPMDPAKAEWTDGERLPDRERQIAYGVESFFLGHDVSDRFRNTYGMPAGRSPIAPAPRPEEK